jgi:hypothetical protein
MAATVTASIASLILTVDDPLRDDLTVVKVWASTTNGFTPSAGNLVYTGNALTILLANLTPLTTYYIRYAYISEIDPDEYDYAAQLSGTPNKIDGSIIVDGSVSANQISATALRGKMFVGSVLMDLGTLATSTIAATGNPTTTFTLNVLDTVDFPSSGAALIISKINSLWSSVVRYTGKTSTSFTGVSGIEFASVSVGDAILPIAAHGFATDTDGYPGGTTWETSANGYGFRAGSGSALAIHPDYAADLFTYTAQGIYSSGSAYEWFTGVSGLATWSGYSKTIVDNNNLPTTQILTTGSYSTLLLLPLINQNDVRIPPNGGELFLVSLTVVGIQWVKYKSYSGSTVVLNDSYTLDAGTYYVIPVFSVTAVGAGIPFVTATNSSENSGHTKIQKIDDYQNELGTTNFYGRVSISTINSSENLPASTLSINAPSYNGQSVMPLYMGYLDGATLDLAPVQFGGGFGMVNYAGTASSQEYLPIVWQSGSTTPNYYYLQGMVAKHFFTPPGNATYDCISFDDSTNTYSFNADAGSDNAYAKAVSFVVGDAVPNSSVGFNCDKSISVNSTRYAALNILRITDATLTADRSSYGAYNQTIGTYQNSAAFTLSIYGARNTAQCDTDSGNSVNGEGILYGSYNYGIHDTNNATYFRMETGYGAYCFAQSSGDVSLLDNAYGVYARVRTSGVAGTSTASTISGTTLTVGGTVAGGFRVGDTITGTGVTAGTTITALGTGNGGAGTYTVSVSHSLTSRAINVSASVGITNAYGVFSVIDAATANKNISTAYNIYLASSETGSITNKWGIYQNNDWPNRFLGELDILGAINVPPTVSVPTTGSTITLTTASNVLCLNHSATIATLTINFPSSPSDGHCISICSRAAVTTLTLGNGTFRGAITTIAAGGFAEYIYSTTGAAWFRKG